MCVVPDIQKAISFTADELLFETLEFNDGKPDADKKKSNLHSDILGNFFLYFYDQSSPDASGQIDSGRKLRYGIISIYEQIKKLGEIGVYAYALFFKTVEEAEIHWKDLLAIDDADTHLDKLNPYDNALAENFFSILKTECIYRTKIATLSEAKALIDDYIYFYNNQRIQTKTKLTPMEFRCQYVA